MLSPSSSVSSKSITINKPIKESSMTCRVAEKLTFSDSRSVSTYKKEPNTVFTTMSRKTTIMCLSAALLLVFLFTVVSFTWGFLFHQIETLPEPPPPHPVIYESVLIGAAFGVLSMVAVLAVAVPATAVSVITVVVLLAFSGKSPKSLVAEANKITREVAGYFGRAMLKEGNVVAAVFTVLGYFALVNWNRGPVGAVHSHGMVRE